MIEKKNDKHLEKFKSLFDEKEKDVINFLLKQDLIKIATIRNYCLVMDLKELQFSKNYSYAKSIVIISKQYSITTRRVREIYKKHMSYKKPYYKTTL